MPYMKNMFLNQIKSIFSLLVLYIIRSLKFKIIIKKKIYQSHQNLMRLCFAKCARTNES